jgi:nickel-dependent lactate racemase
MHISFPYPEMKSVKVAEENLLGVFSPSIMKTEETEEEIIERAFLHPIGSGPLSSMLKGCRNVLILVDDHTRTTSVQKVLPGLLKELNTAGIKPGGIKFLVALGTHRPMNQEEMIKKFGREITEKYAFFNHNWWDPSHLSYLGATKGGTPIFVNRLAQEVDFIIGIGQIVPHRVSGFGGGGNIIQPGICGEETTGKTHWLSAQFTGREILGKIENPIKQEINTIAQKAGLRWIINTIQDGSDRVVGMVAGDPVRAYREGAAISRRVYQAELPQEADIVIADSHPYNSDLWLAAKGIYAAELAVKQGGVVILVSTCPEGISPSHPEVIEFGYQTFKDAEQKVRAGIIKKLTAAAHLVHVGRVIKERARGIMVSSGISKSDTERLGFIHAREPQEALDIAFSLSGRDAKVAVLQRGGEILPVIEKT